jgi:CTP:molybdopterin cytidylyltransferase MocA
MTPARHGVVLLAAGGSRRLGQPKQLVQMAGETLVHRAARLALATAPADAVLVLGAHAEAVLAGVATLALRPVQCADWERGMGTSLRAGLAALSPACQGALVLLCDQPDLDATHLQALVQAWRRDPSRAAASAYAGVLGVPALLPRAWFPELAALGGDRGARDLLRQRARDVQAVACFPLARDIDTPTDLHGHGPASLGPGNQQE